MAGLRARMDGARVGALVGAVGGLLFLLLNAGALSESWATLVYFFGSLLFLLVLWLVLRTPEDPGAYRPDARQMQAFWIVVGLEVVAIVGGTNLLIHVLDRPLASLPWVATVLGVHWLAFHLVFQQEVFLWLGWLTLTCGVAGLLVALTDAGPPESIAIISGLLVGLILLWAIGLDAARRRRRLVKPAPRQRSRNRRG